MKKTCVVLTLIGLTLFAGPEGAAADDSDSQVRTNLLPAAERFVDWLVKEDFASAVGRFDAPMQKALPEARLRETWRALGEQTGAFKQRLGTRILSLGGYEMVFVTCEFERAVVDAKVVFDGSGQIAGLFFVPGKRPGPDAASPAVAPRTVSEREIRVGEGDRALKGTLSVPATGEAAPWPAVVLVHGSGPGDQDETVLANKPFRDLAWGLAAKGVAVLRYEKRTRAYPGQFAALGAFTVKEETLDDALSAVRLLRGTEGVAAHRIFVLGHSLGGTVAPRIGQADPGIAGLVILAGSTRPIEELLIEQTRYLLSLDGGLSADDQAKVAELEAAVDKVRKLTPPDASSSGYVLGAPPAYWLDLRAYDAAATARTLRQPLLILQGGRDYQVTRKDFDGWKEALASRPQVTFKFYPELNHLFIAGEGRSTPAEYEQPGRVADEVIHDVAAWIASGPREPGGARQVQPRQPDGQGTVEITGELKQWHKVTLTLDGPFAHERDQEPNPFTDRRFTVNFRHESGSPSYVVPGYFAADGDAANTSAESGTKWRAHLSPDKAGTWSYAVSLVQGQNVAVDEAAAQRASSALAASGTFIVAPTDKTGRDFRAKGRLEYVGQRYLQFAGTKDYFLKAGPDAPENLLAYADFDGTRANKRRTAREGEATPGGGLKTWQPHVRDWQAGDPGWKNGQGKGLIGALNYLAGKGANAFSFLTYNAGGDGDDVWPFVERDDKFHYDCSKLDQWGIVFDHATARGLYLHFKLQETEIDDNRLGDQAGPGRVPEALDGGQLGPERKLYCRELIARFAHHLALNWNIGEENTQSTEEVRDMARYLHDTDPYRHPIVIHTFPNQQDKVYPPLLGNRSELTGASLQNSWSQAHQRTLKWVTESARAGKPWVVAHDEQNPAEMGVPPDPGYAGHSGEATQDGKPYTLHDIRKLCLWGTLMAGGAGVEYYFGYRLPQNDLLCEDYRSRDRSWDFCRVALDFFREERIPFWKMASADGLVGNETNDNRRYCFALPGEIYLVYLPNGGGAELDLGRARAGAFTVRWFNPRIGGPLLEGPVKTVQGPDKVSLGQPPSDASEDWLAVVRAR